MSILKPGDDLYIELRDCTGEKRDLEPFFAEIAQIAAKYDLKVSMVANFHGLVSYVTEVLNLIAEKGSKDEKQDNS